VFLHALRALLHRDGTALVAAKRFYFGVGGSTAAFVAAAARYGDMKCQRIKVYQDGRSNIRELVAVTWRKPAGAVRAV
jgi:hypothetical protein